MSLYLTDLATWLWDAGLNVVEYEGWQTRARSSGGYQDYPLCVMWHHTASPASWDGQKDADYCAVGADIAPVSNLYIDRSGTVWVLAAGATNTNGSGNSIGFSRGTVPTDCMNTHAVGVEMGNDGVGEPWPREQIDAMFMVSNVVNFYCGNQPDDVSTHWYYAPTRKIDPATAESVQGPWKPNPCTGSGTWDLLDIQDECLARAGLEPPPITPIAPEGMQSVNYYRDDRPDGWQIWVLGLDARGMVWTCPIEDLPDMGKWEYVSLIVGDPPCIPFAYLCGLMDQQNRPTPV